jgi:hypothetical protein
MANRKRYTLEVMRAGKWHKVYSTVDFKTIRHDIAELIAEGLRARYTESLMQDRSPVFEVMLHGGLQGSFLLLSWH